MKEKMRNCSGTDTEWNPNRHSCTRGRTEAGLAPPTGFEGFPEGHSQSPDPTAGGLNQGTRLGEFPALIKLLTPAAAPDRLLQELGLSSSPPARRKAGTMPRQRAPSFLSSEAAKIEEGPLLRRGCTGPRTAHRTPGGSRQGALSLALPSPLGSRRLRTESQLTECMPHRGHTEQQAALSMLHAPSLQHPPGTSEVCNHTYTGGVGERERARLHGTAHLPSLGTPLEHTHSLPLCLIWVQ